ncbi:MAG: hypothetical protein WC489_00920 [Patescibacteria group bacterium]
MAELVSGKEQRFPEEVLFILFYGLPPTKQERIFLNQLHNNGYATHVVPGGDVYPGDSIIDLRTRTLFCDDEAPRWLDQFLLRSKLRQTIQQEVLMTAIYGDRSNEERLRLTEGGTHVFLPSHNIAFTCADDQGLLETNLRTWKSIGYQSYSLSPHDYFPDVHTHADMVSFVGTDRVGQPFAVVDEGYLAANEASFKASGLPIKTVDKWEVYRGGLNIAVLGGGKHYVVLEGTQMAKFLPEVCGEERIIFAPPSLFSFEKNAGPHCRIGDVHIKNLQK